MRVPISDITLEGGRLIVQIPRDSLGEVMGFMRKKKPITYDLEIKQHREKRSLDANAYCWTLIGKLAKELRVSPLEVYREAVRGVGGNYEILPVRADAAEKFRQTWQSQGLAWMCDDMGASKIPGYRNLRCYYGSSSYDTTQMSQLIDNIVQDCKALGIETLSPEKLALMLEEHEKGYQSAGLSKGG